MGVWNDDELDSTEGVEFRLEPRRDRDRRMQDEPIVVESEYGHTNGDRDQPGLPTELMLTAPEIRVMLD